MTRFFITAAKPYFLVLLALAGSARAGSSITVEDIVRFGTFGDPGVVSGNSHSDPEVATSPDGEHVAVVVRRGNLDSRTNDGQLLLYGVSAPLLGNAKPVVAAEFSSATNNQPIALVRWLPDNNTLVFVGTRNAELPQVYGYNLRTRTLNQLSRESTELVWYDVATPGQRLVTVSYAPLRRAADDQNCRLSGCRVDATTLVDQTVGYQRSWSQVTMLDLKNQRRWTMPPTESAGSDVARCRGGALHGSVSPDGKYALRLCELAEWPDWWAHYQAIPMKSKQWLAKNPLYAQRMVLLDFERQKVVPVSDAPVVFGTPAPIWIDGGRHAVLPGAFEPLNGASSKETEGRAAAWSALLLDPSTNQLSKIGVYDSAVAQIVEGKWDERKQTLTARTVSEDGKAQPPTQFRRNSAGRWLRMTAPSSGSGVDLTSARRPRIELRVEQGSNEPPLLVAIDHKTESRTVLLNPNPWLAQREIGSVEEMTWTASDGRRWRGGLYYPPEFTPGTKYPLVIQAYGFRKAQFSMAGFVENFAARALAAQGFLVLDLVVNELDDVDNTPDVWRVGQEGIESAIDHLDRSGVLDRTRVGIQGFSYSGPLVGFALTHSAYPFSAAALTSTADYGWWYYLVMGADPYFNSLYGSPPFGDGLKDWVRTAPTFSLDRVCAPMFMWEEKNTLLLWDWYAGLRRLGRPVEYWYLPDGAHELFTVEQRLHMSNLLVDWFRFWLKGDADEEDEKAERYDRWSRMRERKPACVDTSER